MTTTTMVYTGARTPFAVKPITVEADGLVRVTRVWDGQTAWARQCDLELMDATGPVTRLISRVAE
jgi:hypothetical protein